MIFIFLFFPKIVLTSFKLFFSRMPSNHVLPQRSNNLEPLFSFAPLYFCVWRLGGVFTPFSFSFTRPARIHERRLQMFGAVQGDAADPATQQPSPVSSHDPSAAPIIPRAKTRWKKAATAGEQCFGNKTPSRRIGRDFRHL